MTALSSMEISAPAIFNSEGASAVGSLIVNVDSSQWKTPFLSTNPYPLSTALRSQACAGSPPLEIQRYAGFAGAFGRMSR